MLWVCDSFVRLNENEFDFHCELLETKTNVHTTKKQRRRQKKPKKKKAEILQVGGGVCANALSGIKRDAKKETLNQRKRCRFTP
jgi:hypothetical protein